MSKLKTKFKNFGTYETNLIALLLEATVSILIETNKFYKAKILVQDKNGNLRNA